MVTLFDIVSSNYHKKLGDREKLGGVGMAIYRLTRDKRILEEFRETTFIREGIKEDPDLRYILRNQPEIIEDGLFILSEEFSGKWQGSGRSIDLLGLDQNGRLTVIELKRTSTGDYAELQAIRYAAMIRVLDSDDIVDAHRSYMNKWNIEGDARSRIQEHLSTTEFEEIYTDTPRIILVSEGFSRELTTSVLWLNQNGLDITCIKLQPHLNDKELLIESSQIIPVPGTEGLLVQAQEKKEEIRQQRSERNPRILGGQVFQESILQTPEPVQSGLRQLYEWSANLAEEELVVLSTYRGSQRGREIIRLALKVPNKSTLVQVLSSGEIRFWPDGFNQLAPKMTNRLDSLFGLELAQGRTNYRSLSSITDMKGLTDALTEAYREANGLPVGEENPGD